MYRTCTTDISYQPQTHYYTLHTLLCHWYSYQGLHQSVHKFCGGRVSSIECIAEVAADCEGCGHGTQINLVGNL